MILLQRQHASPTEKRGKTPSLPQAPRPPFAPRGRAGSSAAGAELRGRSRWGRSCGGAAAAGPQSGAGAGEAGVMAARQLLLLRRGYSSAGAAEYLHRSIVPTMHYQKSLPRYRRARRGRGQRSGAAGPQPWGVCWEERAREGRERKGRNGHERKGREAACSGWLWCLCSLPETSWRRMALFFKAQIQPSSHFQKLRLESNPCRCNGVTL